jgi:hypothetical protein
MKNADSINECYETVLRDHAILRGLLDEIKQVLVKRAVDVTEMLGKLQRLNELITEHFKVEESSGCFSDMVSHAPHMSEKVGLLLAEHEQLQAALACQIEYVSGCQGTGEQWQKIGADFEKFHDSLMQHENAENELVQLVFTQDIGDKD